MTAIEKQRRSIEALEDWRRVALALLAGSEAALVVARAELKDMEKAQ